MAIDEWSWIGYDPGQILPALSTKAQPEILLRHYLRLPYRLNEEFRHWQ